MTTQNSDEQPISHSWNPQDLTKQPFSQFRLGRSYRFSLPTPLPWVNAIRWSTVLLLTGAFVFFIAISWRWRLMVDTEVMHYVVYLMRHGLRPYVDISDNNMPGSYLAEMAAMRLFGSGDVGWRVYEFSLLATLTGTLAYLARPWDWAAGIFAGGLFIALHAFEGPYYAAERELVLATLLALALASFFAAVRQQRPAWTLLFGLVTGLAVSIKPTFLPVAVFIPLLAAFHLRRTRRSPWLFMAWAMVGFLLILALDVGFLLHYHAFSGFLFVLREVLPAYAGLVPMGQFHLFTLSLPHAVILLLILTLPLAVTNQRHSATWRIQRGDWERWAIFFTAVAGLISFLAQRKSMLHHRYVFEIFLLLLIGLEIFTALRQSGRQRFLAVTGLLFVLAWWVPKNMRGAGHAVGHSDLELALESDLSHIGGHDALQQKVMCFDMVFGCLDALYHMDIVENTGFTGDLLFFFPVETAPVRYYRTRYWQLTAIHPPEVLVLTNQHLGYSDSFDRIQTWPAFVTTLNRDYTQVVERHFTFEKFGSRTFQHAGTAADPVAPAEQDAYRLYIRKDSPLLTHAEGLNAALAAGQTPQ